VLKFDGLRAMWTRRIGPTAADHYVRRAKLLLVTVTVGPIFSVAFGLCSTKNAVSLLAVAVLGAAWLALYIRTGVEQHRLHREMRKALGLTRRQRVWTIPREEEPYRRWCERRGLTPNPFAGSEGASQAHDAPSTDAPAVARRKQGQPE